MKFRTILYVLALSSMALAVGLEAGAAKPRKPKPTTGQQTTPQQAAQRLSPEMIKLYEQAHTGNPAAQNELGLRLLQGNGVQQNDTLACRFFGQAAKQKYPRAIVNLAYCVRHGRGITKDSIQARDLYVNAMGQGGDSIVNVLDKASRNDIFLAKTLAYAYLNGKGGLKRNPGAAKAYLKRAVDLGDSESIYPYAELCMRTRDNVSAQKAFRQAYEAGNQMAGYWYGRYLLNGEGGETDPAKGFALVREHALQGLPGAMEIVGMCLLHGNGTEKNAEKGAEWLAKAAQAGNLVAQWELAECLATGNGVPQNLLQAFRWMDREAMHSSENRFKNFLNPKDGDNAGFKAYILFLQGLKALDGRDFTTVGKVAKELTKLKVPGNEGKLLEALVLLDADNPKRNVKKGFKAIEPFMATDQLVLFIVNKMQVAGELADLDQASRRKVVNDLEKLGEQGFGPAYSLLGDIYHNGLEGLQENDIKAINNWRKAAELDGLSYNSAQMLAQCYENGLGGLKKNLEAAKKLRNSHRIQATPKLLELVPDYQSK